MIGIVGEFLCWNYSLFHIVESHRSKQVLIWLYIALGIYWTLSVASVYLYWSGKVGKFKFGLVRRLHVAVILFCSEFIYSYIACILTILILRGKITTWFELSSNHVPLHTYILHWPKYVLFAGPLKFCHYHRTNHDVVGL